MITDASSPSSLSPQHQQQYIHHTGAGTNGLVPLGAMSATGLYHTHIPTPSGWVDHPTLPRIAVPEGAAEQPSFELVSDPSTSAAAAAATTAGAGTSYYVAKEDIEPGTVILRESPMLYLVSDDAQQGKPSSRAIQLAVAARLSQDEKLEWRRMPRAGNVARGDVAQATFMANAKKHSKGYAIWRSLKVRRRLTG